MKHTSWSNDLMRMNIKITFHAHAYRHTSWCTFRCSVVFISDNGTMGNIHGHKSSHKSKSPDDHRVTESHTSSTVTPTSQSASILKLFQVSHFVAFSRVDQVFMLEDRKSESRRLPTEFGYFVLITFFFVFLLRPYLLLLLVRGFAGYSLAWYRRVCFFSGGSGVACTKVFADPGWPSALDKKRHKGLLWRPPHL